MGQSSQNLNTEHGDGFMTISIDVEDMISGNQAPCINIDESMALETFFDTLEANGFGPFSELNSWSGLMVDREGTIWEDKLLKKSLSSLGFKDRSKVIIARSFIDWPGFSTYKDEPTIGVPEKIVPTFTIGPIKPIPEMKIGPIKEIPKPVIGYDQLTDLALLRILLMSNIKLTSYGRPEALSAIDRKRQSGGVQMSLPSILRKATVSTPLGPFPKANFVFKCSVLSEKEWALHLVHSVPDLSDLDSKVGIFSLIGSRCKECNQPFVLNYDLG
jgi:hypothetical protein